jgi:hypothetical protein
MYISDIIRRTQLSKKEKLMSEIDKVVCTLPNAEAVATAYDTLLLEGFSSPSYVQSLPLSQYDESLKTALVKRAGTDITGGQIFGELREAAILAYCQKQSSESCDGADLGWELVGKMVGTLIRFMYHFREDNV